MKDKIIYILLGALVGGVVAIVVSVSLASPAIPNPGHGTSQIEGNADLNMNSNKIINLTDPTSAQDATTKAYVDGVGGLSLVCEKFSGNHTCVGCADQSCQACTDKSVECPVGTIRTGGGMSTLGNYADSYIWISEPTSLNGWHCIASKIYAYCYAVCCTIQ